MIGKRFGEKKFSSRGMYIRSTSDIPPNWNDMRSVADIPELYEIMAEERLVSYEENNTPPWRRK